MIMGLGASALFAFAKWGIGTIATQMAAAKEIEANATTERERLWAQERIKQLEAKRDVLVAESGHRVSGAVNSIFRALLAAPAGIVLWKILVWDKALGQWTHGTTDALSVELWGVIGAVISFYFLVEYGRTRSRG